MTRITPFKAAARAIGNITICFLLGMLSARLARYLGAPTELWLLAFAAVTGACLAVGYFTRNSDA